ncbi:nestin [Salvelinus namaycush]|uniref:Nestin n=1 Tax=Salvelinus namaycush TaxID=8040 RepID=A0A8U0TZC6_SALNM|nr:nestin [Salvelinus namaycush]
MELHSLRHHHSHRTDNKLQMLNLNQRLETYLGRVRLLEEENTLLCQELQALRGCGQGGRMGLEDKLSLARQEVEEAWREKDQVELELGSLGEELQVLGLQRQWEADAHGEVKKKLADSRKEMEEERRAQIWLREKVSQLEKQIQFQIQTHQEDVAGFQATLIQVRPALPPPPSQTGTQLPSLQDLGEEYSQMAVRAWHEAAMVFQGQVDSLDESLNQARSRLAQVGQEKIESQLKLKALENELQSVQDRRQYLERSVAKQRDRERQEIQNLQAHLEVLEIEKGALGNQIDALLTESRGLVQLKMSLGMEVATYRALLDNESLTGDFSSTNQPRSTYTSDGVPSSRGVKQSFQTQLATSQMISPISTFHRASPRSNVTMMSASPIWTQNRITLNETPESCRKTEEEHVNFDLGSNRQVSWSTPYPKVPQDGISVDHFRPKDVHEEVNYAEPLSPPTEEAGADVVSWLGSDHKEQSMWDLEKEEEDQNIVRTWVAEEKPVLESAMSHQVETSFSMPTVFSTDAQELYSPSVSYERAVSVTGAHSAFSANDDNDVPFEMSSEKEEPLLDLPYGPMNALEERDLETARKDAEWVGKEGLESETKSVLEHAFETFTSSQAFEYGAGKSYNKPKEFNQEDNMSYASIQASHGSEEAFHHVKRVEEDVINLTKEDDENDMSNKDEEQLEDELRPYGAELEGDSYAQDNTLADTHPLIRYKSDETDANTQASHMGESDSSDGEEDREVCQTGTGTWGEGKSKQFDTMEDLYEESEGDVIDQESNMGSTHQEDMDASQTNEHATQENDEENAVDQLIQKTEEEQSYEELTEPGEYSMVCSDEDYNEERIDRLVEQDSLNSRPESQTNMNNSDIEESNSTDDESPNASQYLQPANEANLTADQEDLLDVAVSHYEDCNALIEHSAEEVTSYQASHECLQTDKWEVLESPNKHLESGDPFAGHKRDSERSSETDSKGRDRHSFLSSGVHSNFWGSNLETEAPYQPDEPYDHVTELPNQNLALADNLSWVDLESTIHNPQSNWNTKMDSDTPKASTLEEEDKQMPSQVKQLVCRDVVEGVNVTSEGSEDEGDSRSSGEE